MTFCLDIVTIKKEELNCGSVLGYISSLVQAVSVRLACIITLPFHKGRPSVFAVPKREKVCSVVNPWRVISSHCSFSDSVT